MIRASGWCCCRVVEFLLVGVVGFFFFLSVESGGEEKCNTA